MGLEREAVRDTRKKGHFEIIITWHELSRTEGTFIK